MAPCGTQMPRIGDGRDHCQGVFVGFGLLQVLLLMAAVLVALVVGVVAWNRRNRRALGEAVAESAAAHRADFSRVIHGGRYCLAYDPEQRLLCAAGRKLPAPVVFGADQVTGIELVDLGDDLPPPRKSPVGRALVGGVLFGGVGAVVGAASGLSDSGGEGLHLFCVQLFTSHPDLPRHELFFDSRREAHACRAQVRALLRPGSGVLGDSA